jgi:hypothetical protein
MYTKLSKYGFSSLSIYPDALVEGMQGARSADEVYRILKEKMRQGHRVSSHLSGDAMDFRTRNLTQSQIATLKAAGEALGAKVLWEEDHLHMQGFKGAPVLLWVGIGAALVGTAVVLRVAKVL